MKRFFLFCVSTFALQNMYGQSQTLKYGKLEPVNKRAITILPNSKTETNLILNGQNTSKDVVLVGGSMNPSLGGNQILNKTTTTKLPFDNSSVKANGTSSSTTGLMPLTEYNIPVTPSSNNNGLGSLIDNTNFSLTNKSVTSNSSNTFLEPLTYLPTKTDQPAKETVDPSRIKHSSSGGEKSAYTSPNQKNTIPTTSVFKMPELAPIDGIEVKKNTTTTTSSSNGMPDLAPIDGIEVKKSLRK